MSPLVWLDRVPPLFNACESSWFEGNTIECFLNLQIYSHDLEVCSSRIYDSIRLRFYLVVFHVFSYVLYYIFYEILQVENNISYYNLYCCISFISYLCQVAGLGSLVVLIIMSRLCYTLSCEKLCIHRITILERS